MKNYLQLQRAILCATALGTLTLSSAARAESRELPIGNSGAIKYYVSDFTKELWVELPAAAKITILDVDPGAKDDRFMVTLKSAYNSNLARPEIADLRNRYPKYKIVEEHGFMRLNGVVNLDIGGGDTLVLEGTPSGEVELYGQTTMSAKRGLALISRLRAGFKPNIEMNVSYGHPYLEVREEFTLKSSSLCAAAQSVAGPEPITDVVSRLIPDLADQLSTVRSANVRRQAVRQTLKDCLSLDQPASVSKLEDVLNVRVNKSAGVVTNKTLLDADVQVQPRTRDMQVEFTWELK